MTAPLHRFWPEASVGLIRELGLTIDRAGGRLWIVGGAVRDALRGESGADLDVEIFGLSRAQLDPILRSTGRFHFVGKAFPVWTSHADHIDIALPRRERASGPRHQDFAIAVDPFMSLGEAAARRDFTINAMLYDPLAERLADPHHGQRDLKAGILRHTSPQFSEDALRVLRAMQFAARFEFRVAPSTIDRCRALTAAHLPRERLWGEWEKLLLKGRRPALGLEFLRACGWMHDYPELAALAGCPQDAKWHPEGDVWNHTLACLDAFARSREDDREEDLVVGLAVLCHDFGKATQTIFADGRWRSPEHEAAGPQLARQFLHRLTRETSLLEAVLPLVGTHMRPFQLYRARAGDSAVRRLARAAGRIDRLVRVSKADARGRIGSENDAFPAGTWLLDRASALAVRAQEPRPLVQGRDLIKLGVAPGPAMGRLLDRLFELQLDGRFTSHEDGMSKAKELL